MWPNTYTNISAEKQYYKINIFPAKEKKLYCFMALYILNNLILIKLLQRF